MLNYDNFESKDLSNKIEGEVSTLFFDENSIYIITGNGWILEYLIKENSHIRIRKLFKEFPFAIKKYGNEHLILA